MCFGIRIFEHRLQALSIIRRRTALKGDLKEAREGTDEYHLFILDILRCNTLTESASLPEWPPTTQKRKTPRETRGSSMNETNYRKNFKLISIKSSKSIF
jgi:hypothetical protein